MFIRLTEKIFVYTLPAFVTLNKQKGHLSPPRNAFLCLKTTKFEELFMPIYEITEPGGARRLRVAVGVDGKLRQKYFTLSNNRKKTSVEEESKILRKAERLNVKWEKEKEKAAMGRAISATTTKRGESVYDTGVRGLKMVWVAKKRPTSTHYRPAFRVHVAEGHTQQGVLTIGHKKAWKLAVKKYCDLKGFRKNAHLIERIPDKSKWEDLRKYYNEKLGWDIPQVAIKD